MAAAGCTPCCADRTDSGSDCWPEVAGHSAAGLDSDGRSRPRCAPGRSNRSWARTPPPPGRHRGHCAGIASSSRRSIRRRRRVPRRSGAGAGRARSRLPVSVVQVDLLLVRGLAGDSRWEGWGE